MGHKHHAGKRARHDESHHDRAEGGATPGKHTRVHAGGSHHGSKKAGHAKKKDKKHKGDSGGGEAEKLPLEAPELFRLWGYSAEDPYLDANHKRALANFAKDMNANDRLIMITGHTSKDEDEGIGTVRALEAQDELRRLGIADARLVDAVGKGHKVPLKGGRDRRVEIYYVDATDLVSPTTDADVGQVGEKSPESGEAHEWLEYIKLGTEAFHVIEVVTESLAFGLASLVTPLLEMVIVAGEEGVAAKNWIRSAYFDGAITGAGDARLDIIGGASRVDADNIYARVLDAYHGSRTEVFSNIFAYQDQVVTALSSGVQVSVETFNPVMEAVETQVAAKLERDRPGSWKSIYDKIIGTLRTDAATALREAIVAAVQNERN